MEILTILSVLAVIFGGILAFVGIFIERGDKPSEKEALQVDKEQLFINVLQGRYDMAHDLAEELESAKNRAEEKNTILTQQIIEATRQRDISRSEVTTLNERVGRLEQDLASLKGTIEERGRHIQELEDQLFENMAAVAMIREKTARIIREFGLPKTIGDVPEYLKRGWSSNER